MQDDLAESLDNFIFKDFIDNLSTAVQGNGFVIDDDGKADWAIRKIIKYQNEINKITALTKDRIEKTKKWQEEGVAELEHSIEFFQTKLEPYAKSKLIGKSKTVKMPSGNISFREKPSDYFIAGSKVDGKNQRLLDHIRQADPDYLKIEESVNWDKYKSSLTVTSTGQIITADGELLDFISAIEYPDSVSVKERK